jgi:hypothetical protein
MSETALLRTDVACITMPFWMANHGGSSGLLFACPLPAGSDVARQSFCEFSNFAHLLPA